MRLLPKSLKGQLVLLSLITLLLSQAAGFLFILNDQRSMLTGEWFHNILNRTLTVRDAIETIPDEYHQKLIKSITNWGLRFSIDAKPSSTAHQEERDPIVKEELKKVFKDGADSVSVDIHTMLNEETRFELLFGDLWRDLQHTLFPKSSFIPKPPARPAYAHMSLPLNNGKWLNVVVMPKGFAPPAWPLIAQLFVMAAFSALSITLVLARLTRPLKELASAASALGRGETSSKLKEEGPLEIAETVRAFNDMQERLSRFVHDRTKMLAALGHDLRTPITTLRLRAEFIDDDEVKLKILQTLDEMLEMAEATLSFAREEAAQEETRLVDVAALTSTVCADLSDAGLAVAYADGASFTVRCRPVGLKRALRNIIENAVSYGQQARVSLQHERNDVAIVIDDDGPGIPDDEMEKVFKPFVRLESSRNRNTGGVGLGLAIARSIIRSHGGDIGLANRPEGGLRAMIVLPRATQDVPRLPALSKAA